MIKLLDAGFARVRKSSVFYLLMFFTVGLALFMSFAMYNDMKNYGERMDAGQLMLNYATIVGIVIAIFTSLFLGVEYSDGTVRNKISVGHKRIQIYLSNLLNNAVNYSDGDLDIVLTENGEIIFTNTASELNEVQVGKLFDRFYTVDNGRNSTGLGLSIAKTLVLQMNGTITAKYENKRFRITLSFPKL